MVADTVMPIRPEWLTAGGSARAQFYRVRDATCRRGCGDAEMLRAVCSTTPRWKDYERVFPRCDLHRTSWRFGAGRKGTKLWIEFRT